MYRTKGKGHNFSKWRVFLILKYLKINMETFLISMSFSDVKISINLGNFPRILFLIFILYYRKYIMIMFRLYIIGHVV